MRRSDLPDSGISDAAFHYMKASPKILLALTAVAALSVAYPAKANLVTNGGFESGDFPPGWTLGGDTGFDSVRGPDFGINPHSGSFQALLSVSTGSSISQMLALTVGTTYTVDFWLANNDFGATSFAASLGGVTGFSVTNAGPSAYTEHTFNFTYTGGSTELLFTDSRTDGAWLLDDVSVNPKGVGVPDGGSTVSLLSFALLGLAALRRRLGC